MSQYLKYCAHRKKIMKNSSFVEGDRHPRELSTKQSITDFEQKNSW